MNVQIQTQHVQKKNKIKLSVDLPLIVPAAKIICIFAIIVTISIIVTAIIIND